MVKNGSCIISGRSGSHGLLISTRRSVSTSSPSIYIASIQLPFLAEHKSPRRKRHPIFDVFGQCRTERRRERRRERHAAESSEQRETRLARRRVADRARFAAICR